MNAPFSAESLQVLVQSLGIMAEGMTGIFAFMAVFYGLILLLNHLFKEKPHKEV